MAAGRGVLLLVSMVAMVATTATLPAHGGQFRGRRWTDVTPPPSAPAPPSMPALPGPTTGGLTGPTTGTPMPGFGGPSTPGPLSGDRHAVSDGTSWQVWWEFNKDPLLGDPTIPMASPVTGSTEYFLGIRQPEAGQDTMQANPADCRDRIVPALLRALASTDNRDVTTACLVALAKVGIAPPGTELRPTFTARVGDDNQEVRETAALAMGIAGEHAAVDDLTALLLSTRQGRKLADRNEVQDRTRTFAAWSLGLLARRSSDVSVKRRVREVLVARLQDREEQQRDLRVALIQGLGLLQPEPERSGAEKMLLWQTVGDLWTFYERDLGKGDQLVQAHVPIAVARLLGRGTSAEHERAKTILLGELSMRKRRHNTIYQSAALALGSLSLPREVRPEDAACSEALLKLYREGNDQLARFFGAIALGRIGGDANREALLTLYPLASKSIERPWVALALGLCARERARGPGGAVDLEVGRLLRRDLHDIDNDDAQSAFALALGLCGYRVAADDMLDLLRARGRSDLLTGYLAVALALLDHKPAADQLVELMRKSTRRPLVLLQCSVALGRLGDVRVVPLLQEMLQKSDSTATLSAVAAALGRIGDRRSIDQLIEVLDDPGRTKLARAFAAAALGGIGDKDELPWNTPIALDLNYMATVDTLTNGQTGVLDIL